MNTNNRTRNLIMNALLISLGVILHEMMPPLVLAMLFIVVLLNKDDYKACLVCALIMGIFTALSTKFPAGQIPNIVDKLVTVNVTYFLLKVLCRSNFIKDLQRKKRDEMLISIILPIGTIVSGVAFLWTVKVIADIPVNFAIMFITIVIPTAILNSVTGIVLFRVLYIALRRSSLIRINE